MADEKEKQAFYKTNAKILKLDTIKDRDLIIFNHHIEKEENLQRLSGELQKGLFKFSYTTTMEKLKFSRWKLQKIVKYFEDNKIIECIEKSTKKGVPSIYAYTSVYYEVDNTNCNTDYNTNCNTNLSSVSNDLECIDNTNCNTNYNTNCNTLKKELLKRDIKNNNMSDSKESDAPPGAFKDSINTNKKTKSSKKKTTKDYSNEVKEVVEYLNLKANRNYRPGTTKTKSLISARLKDYTVEDLKAVIDFKVDKWLNAEWYDKQGNLVQGKNFLRPSTLFNETNFENYINELPGQAIEVEEKELPPITAEEFYDI